MLKKISIRPLLLAAFCTTALTACGTSNDVSYAQKSQAPRPPITEMDAAMAQPAPKLLPINSSGSQAGNGAQTPEQRIAQLEATVASLRSDYDRIMPAFASLNTTNERIQVLLDELEVETKTAAVKTQQHSGGAVAPDLSKPAELKLAPSSAVKIPAPQDKQVMMDRAVEEEQGKKTVVFTPATAPEESKVMDSSITAVRIGEHGQKTRLVFDMSSKTKPEFSYDLDNEEKLLMVEMPMSSWVGKEQGKPANSLMVVGWGVQSLPGGGSAIAIQLKKDARVLMTEFLKAEGKDPAKIVIDIGSGG